MNLFKLRQKALRNKPVSGIEGRWVVGLISRLYKSTKKINSKRKTRHVGQQQQSDQLSVSDYHKQNNHIFTDVSPLKSEIRMYKFPSQHSRGSTGQFSMRCDNRALAAPCLLLVWQNCTTAHQKYIYNHFCVQTTCMYPVV